MNFTDDTGGKWEKVSKTPDDYDQIVIRPIKEPKWQVELYQPGLGRAENCIEILLNVTTEDQAQLIKEACEALMEYIFAPYDYENPAQHISAGREKVWHRTRQALQGDK